VIRGHGMATALVAIVLGVATHASAGERERPRLRFDPFAQPDLTAVPGAGPASLARDGEWAPVLTATLVAGDRSLANLGGVLLEIGEESHGYRLLEVRPWEAVFEHGGEQKVLPVTQREGNR